jgi:DNA-binding transcriptional LysR family regulator
MDYLDLRSLQVFVTVCDRGTMTDAAKALGITQSAVSQNMKEIERLVGVALIDRSLRPLRPTPAGSVLYQRGRTLLMDAREAHILAWQYGTGALPKLRIGLNFVLSRSFTTRLVQMLRQRKHPPDLVIWNSGDSDHIHALINRDLDLIISADAIEHLEHFERHEIVRESFVLLVPRSFVGDGHGIDFERLSAKLPLIRYSARTHIGQYIERHLRRIRLNTPRHIEVESPESVVEMVGEGMGWSVLTPLNVIYARGDMTKLRALPLPAAGFNRRLTLVAREGEFGVIPGNIANISRDILRRTAVPELTALDPFLASNFSVVVASRTLPAAERTIPSPGGRAR